MMIRKGWWLAAAAVVGACSSEPELTQVDTDGDGYFDSQDCDDDNSKVSPSAFENCTDGKDNDCDDEVDAADTECGGVVPTTGAGGAGGGGGQGGAGGMGPCSLTCFEALSSGTAICPEATQTSIDRYNAVILCACGSDAVNSKCTAACSDEFCPTKNLMNVQQGSPCQACLQNDQTGCYTALFNCTNDM